MGSAAINYDALAQQHGGAVDYDALAAQHGATTPSTAQAGGDKPGFFQSFADASGLSAAAHAIAHTTQTITPAIDLASDVVHGRPADNNNPIVAAVQNMAQNAKTQGKAAVDAIRQGQYGAAVSHAALAVPVAGQVAQQAMNQTDGNSTANSYGQNLKALVTSPGAMGTITGATMSPVMADGAVEAVNPAINLVRDGAGRAVLLGKTPEAAYESAMKPPTTISQADRDAMTQTGLQNSIPVSKAGVEKIGSLVDDLNSKIKATIEADPNRPIDPNAVAARTDATKQRFSNQVNAQPDLNAIENSRLQFLAEQGAKPGTAATAPQPTGLYDAQGRPYMDSGAPGQPATSAPAMGAADAQSMKQGTYGVLKGKFGEQGSAAVEAQKALARGLKEEIASQFPEIDTMNAAESRLLDLQPVLERAVNRISNHQLIGIGTPVAGAAAEALTGSTGIGKVAMVMKAVLDNPNVKSRLAIAVSKAQKVPIATAMSRVNAYAEGLSASAVASQASSTDGNSDQPTTQQGVQQ
jgi:hypothetical protein